MATSTFDKVFIIKKKADRARLAHVLASNNPAPIQDLPTYSPDDWRKNEAALLQCLSQTN